MNLLNKISSKYSFIFCCLFLISCSSPKRVVQGYDGKELTRVLKQIQGKTVNEAIRKLGQPAVKGLCRKCGQKGLYRVIYLKKDMSQFYLDITYGTDAEVDCIVLDFLPNVRTRKYTFDKATGFYEAKNCNQKDGMIMELKQILDQSQ